jgi:tRNA(Arg) A34 adenosine deaminase TadA
MLYLVLVIIQHKDTNFSSVQRFEEKARNYVSQKFMRLQEELHGADMTDCKIYMTSRPLHVCRRACYWSFIVYRIVMHHGPTEDGTGSREYVRVEDFTAVTMKNGVFWDATPCDCRNNRRFGGT